ncbi:hypothetical protein [Gemmatimonas sp.]
MRLSRLLPWLLLGGLVVFSVAVYGSLPDQLPRNVDLSGEIGRTETKTPLSWAALPLVALSLLVLFEVIRRRLPHRPELFNFPGKDDFLKLPAEYRPPIIAKMQGFLDITASLTTAIMGAVQLMLWHVARGGKSDVVTIGILLVSVMTTPALFLVLQGVTNEVDAAKKRWEGRRQPAAR